MPPSPAMRFSPGRDTARTDNHKRGRSLEGGLLLVRDKDDDLALFDEMQNREDDNFSLLHSTDHFDDSLFSTKLRYFSDFKLDVLIPKRGETSDLLNADADKNDYNWLLTPPDTPLFPSLDDETPSINISHRGRPRSQPISIARSTTMQTERSNRTSRSSASPHRLSPSPRSSNSTIQSRGRPLPAPHSSPPILRHTTPSCSPSRSATPNKLSPPALRSSTPTPRRMSTGSSATVASSGRIATSPVKTSRGSSASPKLQAWQSSIPGFSTEVPPNLRTSLAERPAAYVRGSSPASRNGRGLSPASSSGRGLSPVSSNARGVSPASRNGRESSSKRQSMSPTASRSASSSCSHDRDQFSSQSKGSVLSSGEDDVDSLQSFSASIPDRSAVRKVGAFPSSKAHAFSKKPSRVLSSSAPKRSFDSALRQMDRRSPQNMFRPLLSSVPSTTFYAGKASTAHRPAISRNSSVTTSSNASSEQGTSFVPDTEGSDHEQDHRAAESVNAQDRDVEDGVFAFDKTEEIDEGVAHQVRDEKLTMTHGYLESSPREVELSESENSPDTASAAVASESTCNQDELSEAACEEKTTTCSRCDRDFKITVPVEEYNEICPTCMEKGGFLPLSTSETSLVTGTSTVHSESVKENESPVELGSEKMMVPELQDLTSMCKGLLLKHETNDGKVKSITCENYLGKFMEEEEKHFVDQQVLGELTDASKLSTYDSVDQQPPTVYPSLKVDVYQGMGISVLLKSSSGNKWPVVQGRSFTASSTTFDDLSYARDSMNSMRSSIGHGSASTSSSVDLGSSRQTEARVQRQLSCRKADLENSRHGVNTKPLSRGSSFSGYSSHTPHTMIFDMSTSEENFDVSTGKVELEALEDTLAVTNEEVRTIESDACIRTTINEDYKVDCSESCRAMDAHASVSLSHTSSIVLMDNSASSGNTEELTNSASISDIEVFPSNQEPFFADEDSMLDSGECRIDIVEDPTHESTILVSEELGMDNAHTPGSQNESSLSPNPKGTVNEFQELSITMNSENDLPVSASESCTTDRAHDILEESTVRIEGSGGHNSRSLTLEEATDTILFCSSIIQNIAYQAASIGMEKEHLQSLEGSRPTVTILGKPSPDRKDPRPRVVNKRTPKSIKSRQKHVETNDVSTASPKSETEIKTQRSVPHDLEIPNRVNTPRPMKLESKCNCSVM